MEKIFIDTWGWLCLLDRKEPEHVRVAHLLSASLAEGTRLFTSDYVLDETISLLFRRLSTDLAQMAVHRITNLEGLTTVWMTEERFRAALLFRNQYANRGAISFTDISSFLIMREYALQYVLTGDKHFEEVNLGFTRLPVKE